MIAVGIVDHGGVEKWIAEANAIPLILTSNSVRILVRKIYYSSVLCGESELEWLTVWCGVDTEMDRFGPYSCTNIYSFPYWHYNHILS